MFSRWHTMFVFFFFVYMDGIVLYIEQRAMPHKSTFHDMIEIKNLKKKKVK